MTLGRAWKSAGSLGNRSRGYTLVELLIVVAMIGVLAALAIVGYRKYMNSAQASEAKTMIQGIRNAEEAYKSETLVYLSCSASLTDTYPIPQSALSDHKSAWDNPGSGSYACWRTLNVVADSPVRFGYAVMAGLPGGAPPAPSTDSKPNWPNPTTEPWFVIQAIGDRDNDTVYAYALGSSFTGEIYMENDTE